MQFSFDTDDNVSAASIVLPVFYCFQTLDHFLTERENRH